MERVGQDDGSYLLPESFSRTSPLSILGTAIAAWSHAMN
jgi:hypothetical protein